MTLLGRSSERDRIDRALAAARGGLSDVVVVRGEPGIGKTALLDYAAGAAADLEIARIEAVESEMELAFAGLHQLLVLLHMPLMIHSVEDAQLEKHRTACLDASRNLLKIWREGRKCQKRNKAS